MDYDRIDSGLNVKYEKRNSTDFVPIHVRNSLEIHK